MTLHFNEKPFPCAWAGFLFTALSLLLFSNGHAQNDISSIDSLGQLLEANPGNNTVEEVILYALTKKEQEDHNAYLEALELALKHIDAVSSDSIKVLLHNNMGIACMLTTEFGLSAEHLYQALKIAEQQKDTLQSILTFLNLGTLNLYSNEFDKALEHFFKAETLVNYSDTQVDPEMLGVLIVNLGITLVRKHEYGEARIWFNKGLEHAEKTQQAQLMGTLYNSIGMTYQYENNLMEANLNFKKCLSKCLERGDRRVESYCYQNIAGNFHMLDQYDSAIFYLHKGMAIAQELKLKKVQEEFLRGLSETNYDSENYKDAYSFLRRRLILRDSIYSDKRKEKIAELEELYEAEKRQREIDLLESANNAQSLKLAQVQLVALGLLAIVLLLALAVLFYFFRIRLRTNSRIAALKQNALRAQMNPHFMFNVLSAIQNSVLKDDKFKASNFLAKFAKLTRLVLVNSSQEKVKLKDEIHQLELYLTLEQFRMNKHFTFGIEIEEDIKVDFQKIPNLLIQPFLENAIWHGIAHRDSPGWIQLKVKQENDLLRFTIEDNGVGRTRAAELREKDEINQPMGMQITKDRLELYRLEHRESIGIEITDLTGDQDEAVGTRVEILIPA